MVHRAGAKQIHDTNFSIPPLPEVIQLYETVASAGGTFGTVRVKAIALNTFGLDLAAAEDVIQSTADLTGLPCSDVVRFGGATILSAVYEE